MTPTLLHAVARKADAITPDAELLARYLRDRDHAAFEELVRRHGPLVWSVCRQMLPHRADAEDAFQAVFLALVRGAGRIRDGRTLPAWLHGVAVRVALRARRDFARRRARERAAAAPEADRPVSDSAWESLVAAVHEEVRRLPEAERTAFVLCEMQGVSQPDAAARLGWPLGSVSGRLSKARNRLLARLAARGVAPAAAVGVGVSSGTAWAVPANVFEVVKSFPGAPGAASAAASALARGLTEGVAMRVTLTAAVLVAAIGLTGGAVWLSQAGAQPPSNVPLVTKPPVPPEAPKPPKPPQVAINEKNFDVVRDSRGPLTWEYKFVDVPAERKEFEKAITQHGQDGWEYGGSEPLEKLEWNTGVGARVKQLVLVFKRPKGGAAAGAQAAPGAQRHERLVMTLKHATTETAVEALRAAFPRGVKVTVGGLSRTVEMEGEVPTLEQARKLVADLDARAAKPGTPTGPPVAAKPAGEVTTVFHLTHARAPELAAVLATLLERRDYKPTVAADARANSVVVVGDAQATELARKVVAELDKPAK